MNRLEQMDLIRACKDAQEVVDVAKAHGISLSIKMAQRYFDLLHGGDAQLSDEELDSATGGCGEDSNAPENYLALDSRIACEGCVTKWVCNACGCKNKELVSGLGADKCMDCKAPSDCFHCKHYSTWKGEDICLNP